MPLQRLTASEKSYPRTVAFAETSSHYHRTRLPSGKYRPETYLLGEGICLDKSGSDASLNELSFPDIEDILKQALVTADYIQSPIPEETQLFIRVNWGRTQPFDSGLGDMARNNIAQAMNSIQLNDGNAAIQNSYELELEQQLALQSMVDRARAEENRYNAALLGYVTAIQHTQTLKNTFAPMYYHEQDLFNELENPRYFVILQAYDFQKLLNEKEKDLLWTTRFSIRAKGRKFDESLWAMAMSSSRVFGENTDILWRDLKPARVEFGELDYLGIEE